ncbi:hypothetical protein AMK59_166, partial [Oryctes borbonicus]
MDVSDYLKLGLQGFYKYQGNQFGKRLETRSKANKLQENRKDIRNTVMFKMRSISKNLSPYKTPTVQNKVRTISPQQDPQVKKRLAMLKKWKEQKQQKLNNEKSKAKPIFKVTHISREVGAPDLETVYKMIKGKPINIQTQNKRNNSSQVKYEFAPKNYKFKGPSNLAEKKVKTVTIKCDEDEYRTPKKNLKVYKKTPVKKINNKINNKENTNHYDLRSRKIIIGESKKNTKTNTPKSGKISEQPNKAKKTSTTKTALKNTKVIEEEVNREQEGTDLSASELSPAYTIADHANSSQTDSTESNALKEINTPVSKANPAIYISPFVTISRGKDSARKEFYSRKSKGGLCDSSPDLEVNTGPKAGAAYFHKLLEGEISRIQGLCDEWNLYKEEQKPPEEACDMINVAIGQSQLLINKKFKQFRNLILSCESGDSKMPVTCEDLHGYWDTAYIQVENLNHRFNNLAQLRSNNWEEIISEKEVVVAKKATKTKKVRASSRLKDAIKAAREKAKSQRKTQEIDPIAANTFDGGFFSIQSPEKLPKLILKSASRNSTKARKSLRVDVLMNEKKKRESSPGWIIWKAAQTAKTLEEPINTPGRSILKTRRSKSAVKERP